MIKKNNGNIAKVGLVASLYIVVSLLLSAITFGAIQFRVAEMFNYMQVYNKRYITAVTLGCLVVNLFSPLGMIDVVIGTLSTFIVLTVSHYLGRKTKSIKARYIITFFISLVGMIPIMFELNYLFNLPMGYTLLTLIIGESISMIVGAFFIYNVSKRVDLTK